MARGQQDAQNRPRHLRTREIRAGSFHASVNIPHVDVARSGDSSVAIDSSVTISPTDHDLTVVIPAFNEESRLPATLDGLAAYLDNWGVDYRVLVVDDGSRDATGRLTNGRGPRFSTVSQSNAGKGAAVRNGMLHATGRVVAFTDADLPYDLDGVRAAYEFIDGEQCEVVFGARDLEESAVLAPRRFLRTMATWIFRSIVQQLVSRKVTDTQCGLKVFNRRAAIEIFSRTTIDGFAFDAEVVFLADRLSHSCRRIPVTLINEYGSTISLSRHALPMLLDVIGLRLRALRGEYDLERDLVSNIGAATTADRGRNAA